MASRRVPEVPTRSGVDGEELAAAARAARSSQQEVHTAMSAYANISSGHWVGVAIGVMLVVILVGLVVGAAWRRHRRSRDASIGRCWGLIAEAVIVRRRVSGEIDAATYQEQMKDLVSKGGSQKLPS